jgi:hypothetical protein
MKREDACADDEHVPAAVHDKRDARGLGDPEDEPAK